MHVITSWSFGSPSHCMNGQKTRHLAAAEFWKVQCTCDVRDRRPNLFGTLFLVDDFALFLHAQEKARPVTCELNSHVSRIASQLRAQAEFRRFLRVLQSTIHLRSRALEHDSAFRGSRTDVLRLVVRPWPASARCRAGLTLVRFLFVHYDLRIRAIQVSSCSR